MFIKRTHISLLLGASLFVSRVDGLEVQGQSLRRLRKGQGQDDAKVDADYKDNKIARSLSDIEDEEFFSLLLSRELGELSYDKKPNPPMEGGPPPGQTELTLLDLVTNERRLSTLALALSTAGLTGQFSNAEAGTFTLFGPTNYAFSLVDSEYLNKLLSQSYRLHLIDFLLMHVTLGSATSRNLSTGQELSMGNGQPITVFLPEGEVVLSTASVAAGLAPESRVIDADNIAANGVLHLVNRVVLPQWYFLNPLDAVTGRSDFFSTIATLIDGAGLSDAVAGLIDSTLALPVDSAFAALPANVISFLNNNPDILQQVLLYHVMTALIPFETLNFGRYTFETLQGESVVVTVSPGPTGGTNIAFNGIPLVRQGAILVAQNIIYSIGGVLIPPSLIARLP